MKLELAKNNFFGIKNISLKEADFIIVPFGLEKTVSFGRGTSKGPQSILEASPGLECFDEETEKEIDKEVKISTIKEPDIKQSHEEAIRQLEEIIDRIYSLDKFPLILGGEHSLTLGPITAALKKYKKISILQFDAHADLRDSYEGNKLSHAAVMRRCLDLGGINLVQIGVRNISNEELDGKEFDFWRRNQNRIKTFWAKDMEKWRIRDIINSLAENIYLSFDVDAFDSGLMPSCGTPEPGGLQWNQAMEILKAVASQRNIIGADVVELAPIKDFQAPDFLAAKLVFKIISYVFTYRIAGKYKIQMPVYSLSS